MAFRTFRNEETYDAPEYDWSFMQQAAQHTHDMAMQQRQLNAREKKGKEDGLKDMLGKATTGGSTHPNISKHLDQSVSEAINSVSDEGVDYNTRQRKVAQAAQAATMAKQNEDAYKETEATILKAQNDDPYLNTGELIKETNKIKESGVGPVASEYDPSAHFKDMQDINKGYIKLKEDITSPRFFNSQKQSEDYFKNAWSKAKVQKNGDKYEDKNGVTRSIEISQKAPFVVKTGERTVDVEGTKQIVETYAPATTIKQLKESGDLEAFLNSDQYGRKRAYYEGKLDKKEVEAEAERIATEFNDMNRNNPDVPKVKATDSGILQKATESLVENAAGREMLANNIPETITDKATSREQPRQPTEAERSRMYDVYSMGAEAKTFNTLVGDKGTKMKSRVYGSVGIKSGTGQKPIVTLNEQSVKREGDGKYEDMTEGAEVSVDVIRALAHYKTKDGNEVKLHIDSKYKSPNDYLKTLTPEDVVKKDINVGLEAYVTSKKAAGTSNLGLTQDQQKEYTVLKGRFGKKAPELDPESENYDEKEAGDYKRFVDLGSVLVQKEETFSLPYNQLEGQLGQVIGKKNATEEAIVARMGKEDKAEYLEGKRILEEKRSQYNAGAGKKPAPKAGQPKYVSVTTQAQYDALPAGTKYTDSKGNIATKGSAPAQSKGTSGRNASSQQGLTK